MVERQPCDRGSPQPYPRCFVVLELQKTIDCPCGRGEVPMPGNRAGFSCGSGKVQTHPVIFRVRDGITCLCEAFENRGRYTIATRIGSQTGHPPGSAPVQRSAANPGILARLLRSQAAVGGAQPCATVLPLQASQDLQPEGTEIPGGSGLPHDRVPYGK